MQNSTGSVAGIPECAPMDPLPKAPHFLVPAGAVDCHAHVFGPSSKYPFHPGRTYTPPDASLEEYLHLHQTLGIQRGILVQPSVYGVDNLATRHALQRLRRSGHAYRGVAVVDSSVSDNELDALHEDGFRGVRLNMLFKGGISWKDVTALADRLAERGWHLQFLVDVSEFESFETRIGQLPVPVVIDHMGHMACEKGLAQEGFQALCRALKNGHAWVKLSGAYRITSLDQTPYDDVVPFAQQLIQANPERCVWGSDWPHPHISVPMPNDGALFDELASWAPDVQTRKRILVDNPDALYFGDLA